MSGDLMWPRYAEPGDLAAIETVPLENRGLPASTYELLVMAALGQYAIRRTLQARP